MAIFRTYANPITGVVISGYRYISSLVGSDSNSGAISAPYNTLTKGITNTGAGLVIGAGNYLENVSNVSINNAYLIFEPGAVLNGNFTDGQYACIVVGIRCTGTFTKGLWSSCHTYNSELMGTFGGAYRGSKNFINSARFLASYDDSGYATILEYLNYINNNTNRILKNSIIISSIDLYNYTSRSNTTNYPIFQYCLFRKLTQWKWNGTTIAINWNTNPLNSTAYTDEPLLDRVYNSLLFYANAMTAGTDKTYFQAILATKETMFYADANGQTNKVVDDVLYPIFNKYNGTTPIDYSLKLAANNVALTMSDIGGYVGAYKANLNHVQFGTILHVNADGSDDTVTTPDLLISEGLNQFSASDTSLQLRNRIRTAVLEFPRGKAFDGSQSMLTSGIASRLYFGKYQPMVTTGANPTIPVETIEVIPYDAIPADNSVAQANNLSGKSAFPRFSIMFNGAAEMWYKNNVPLLFSQLANLYTGNGTISNTAGSTTVTGVNTLFTTYLVPGDLITVGGQTVKVQSIASATSLTVDTPITTANTNAAYTVGIYVDKSLTEYGDWAVTNADIEDYSLLFKTAVAGVSKRNIPVKYCKLELNLNYAEE